MQYVFIQGRSPATEVVVETLERITNEWQAHLRRIFTWSSTTCSGRRSSRLQVGGIIGLIDLIRREVGRINIGSEFGLEWCADPAQIFKLDTTEEFVVLDLICPATTKTILSVTNKTMQIISSAHSELVL